MNANRCISKCCALGLVIGLSFLTVGCASLSQSKAGSSYQLADLAGKWTWNQDPWNGNFVLTMDGDKCAGTLDDVYEGTYGDRVKDVTLQGNRVKFTREGKFGSQQWEGKLKKDGKALKIVKGQFSKDNGYKGSFTAEKTE